MAITIQQQPTHTVSAFNDIIYVVSSTNVANTNFNYICDIYLTNDAGAVTIAGRSYIRKRIAADPTYTSGVINIANEVRDQLSYDIGDDSYNGQKSNNSVIRVQCKFGEEYGVSSAITVYPNLTLASQITVWNGGFNLVDFNSYDANSWTGNSGSTTRKVLTNRPSSGVIRSDERAWIYAISKSNTDLGYYCLETWNSAGQLLNNYRFNNTNAVLTSAGNYLIRIPAGLNQFTKIAAGDYVIGSPPVSTANVARYRVYWREGTTFLQDRVDQWYTVIDNTYCTPYTTYRLHFLNELGGFDSFSFTLNSQISVDVKRNSYKKNIISRGGGGVFGYNNSVREDFIFFTELTDKIELNSDWIDETTYQWLEQLITSPVVFIDDATNGLIAVNIIENSYQRRKHITEKAINMKITLEYSYNRIRQGQ